ncbi:MAG: hypothetical protein HWQ35_23105 [Nostoc sp. NMS1]|uniref:hypothetical protein n=1 Tax=unclassified Nostoc TaxID=2593658 RepID=UPI0025E5536F|nr:MULTISPECIES: hypothetical protein [unclassified Nostoc]MBN3909338.1 hypothetical protein [Nostoc sp. NMS1]MBN3993421.1 hypothetical protein [Nostoc sp. NMS2]
MRLLHKTCLQTIQRSQKTSDRTTDNLKTTPIISDRVLLKTTQLILLSQILPVKYQDD